MRTLETNWVVTGTSLEEFKKVLQEKEKSTVFNTCKSDELSLASVYEVTDEDFKVVRLYGNSSQAYSPFKEAPISIVKKDDLRNAGATEELIREIEEQKIFYFDANQNIVLVGDNLDYVQFGLSGEFFAKPSLERDLAIAKAFQKKKPVTLICRKKNGVKKIFALRSGSYTPIPNDNIFEVLDAVNENNALGEAKVVRWEINNRITRIWVKFPEVSKEINDIYCELDELVPGLMIETSDTGDCAFRVQECWYFGSADIHHTSISRKHSGDVDMTALLQKCESKIFSKFTKLPERLLDLLCLDLGVKAYDEKSQKENKIRYEEYFTEISKHIGLVKAVGKKMEVAIREQLLNEYDGKRSFSAYDLVMSFMYLPDRIWSSDEKKQKYAVEQLKDVVFQAAFYDFQPLDDEDEVILLPR